MILILMGVSGIGKTTIGKLLSARTGWAFEDADDYHSDANKNKMAAGIPLTDVDRAPWLDLLHERLTQSIKKGKNVILACSALKQQYRDHLVAGFAANEFRFIYLHAPVNLVREHIHARDHAYMNPNLLDSQMEILEEPVGAWPVLVAGSPAQAVDEIITRLTEIE